MCKQVSLFSVTGNRFHSLKWFLGL